MPQAILPIFSTEFTIISETIGCQKKDGQVYYFQGTMPFYCHNETDKASFRSAVAQIAVLGNATQAQLVRAFGLSAISVKRWVKLHRERGSAGFFLPRKRRGPGVLTPEVLAAVQSDLDQGQLPKQIAEARDLKLDTLKKAIRAGRLHQAKKNLSKAPPKPSAR
jgi:transposase-like protein